MIMLTKIKLYGVKAVCSNKIQDTLTRYNTRVSNVSIYMYARQWQSHLYQLYVSNGSQVTIHIPQLYTYNAMVSS